MVCLVVVVLGLGYSFMVSLLCLVVLLVIVILDDGIDVFDENFDLYVWLVGIDLVMEWIDEIVIDVGIGIVDVDGDWLGIDVFVIELGLIDFVVVWGVDCVGVWLVEWCVVVIMWVDVLVWVVLVGDDFGIMWFGVLWLILFWEYVVWVVWVGLCVVCVDVYDEFGLVWWIVCLLGVYDFWLVLGLV